MLAASSPMLQQAYPHHHHSKGSHPRKNPTKLHHLLSNANFVPNHLTFPDLLNACRKLLVVEEGKQIHAMAIKTGFQDDAFVHRSLARMYAKCLACREALNAYARCSYSDIVLQNDLITGLCRVGDLASARRLFEEMPERNVVSWSVLIDGYCRSGQMEIAQALFDAMPERNQFSWNSLISGYLKCGRLDVGREIFDCRIQEWGVVTWTTMISGYVQNCMFKEALNLFLDMQIAGVMPNEVTVVSVLPAVAHFGALSQGRWIHAYVQKMGMEVDGTLGSALIDVYAKCGCIEDAVTIFKKISHKKLSAWNSIILGLAAHGRGQDALRLFSRMREDFLMMPDDITFIGVLSACSHAGLVDAGQEVFDLCTKHYKLTPNIRHYGCVVDLLARAGRLNEALQFVQKMPIKPNAVIWKTLLSGCRIHKNFELVGHVSRRIINLGPQDSGFHILVSNILNEAGRMDDAGKVRREMNDLQVKKIAGRSWVEVDGVIHEFLAGRESFHAEGEEILNTLRELEVLMDLEESQTELC